MADHSMDGQSYAYKRFSLSYLLFILFIKRQVCRIEFDSSGNFIITKNELIQNWSQALKMLVDIDQSLLDSDAQERTLCYRLAHYLSELFLSAEQRGIYIDVEYNRDGNDRKKTPIPDTCTKHWTAPDIIFHERGSADCTEHPYRNDIFYCEVKKNDCLNNNDKQKIILQMKYRHYQFGINLYQLNRSHIELALYEKNCDGQPEIYHYSFNEGKLIIFD